MLSGMTNRERYLAVMDYRPVDRVPNYEVGVWAQTAEKWRQEGIDETKHSWDWFRGDPAFQMDRRDYAALNLAMCPSFERKVIEETERYEIVQHPNGVITKALKEGTQNGGRMCMDQYIGFPAEDLKSFRELKKRFDPTDPRRGNDKWKESLPEGWAKRDTVLVLGENCSTLGFYWRAREWMGTENLSYAWYMQPELMHEMMEFITDFTIEATRHVLDETDVDYVFINEDMAMKTGPLLGPNLYEDYILPHMKRLVDFYKSNGVQHVWVDSDGNSEPLIPHLLDAGVDGLWPIERAAEQMDPLALRKKYGKALRMSGGVDKRELAKDRQAIDDHLRTLFPLIEQGGFIPTVDHTVQPGVSLDNFRYYMDRKMQMLAGDFF